MRTPSLLLVLIEHGTEVEVDLYKDQIFDLFRKYLDIYCVPSGPLHGPLRWTPGDSEVTLLVPNPGTHALPDKFHRRHWLITFFCIISNYKHYYLKLHKSNAVHRYLKHANNGHKSNTVTSP